ncbi:unnamed protein product [Amoebophrya sp. A25]|nr:unnamed protein product [Amoebophrya sp. A25]|eukprot:GSA25T00011815001.1
MSSLLAWPLEGYSSRAPPAHEISSEPAALAAPRRRGRPKFRVGLSIGADPTSLDSASEHRLRQEFSNITKATPHITKTSAGDPTDVGRGQDQAKYQNIIDAAEAGGSTTSARHVATSSSKDFVVVHDNTSRIISRSGQEQIGVQLGSPNTNTTTGANKNTSSEALKTSPTLSVSSSARRKMSLKRALIKSWAEREGASPRTDPASTTETSIAEDLDEQLGVEDHGEDPLLRSSAGGPVSFSRSGSRQARGGAHGDLMKRRGLLATSASHRGRIGVGGKRKLHRQHLSPTTIASSDQHSEVDYGHARFPESKMNNSTPFNMTPASSPEIAGSNEGKSRPRSSKETTKAKRRTRSKTKGRQKHPDDAGQGNEGDLHLDRFRSSQEQEVDDESSPRAGGASSSEPSTARKLTVAQRLRRAEEQRLSSERRAKDLEAEVRRREADIEHERKRRLAQEAEKTEAEEKYQSALRALEKRLYEEHRETLTRRERELLAEHATAVATLEGALTTEKHHKDEARKEKERIFDDWQAALAEAQASSGKYFAALEEFEDEKKRLEQQREADLAKFEETLRTQVDAAVPQILFQNPMISAAFQPMSHSMNYNMKTGTNKLLSADAAAGGGLGGGNTTLLLPPVTEEQQVLDVDTTQLNLNNVSTAAVTELNMPLTRQLASGDAKSFFERPPSADGMILTEMAKWTPAETEMYYRRKFESRSQEFEAIGRAPPPVAATQPTARVVVDASADLRGSSSSESGEPEAAVQHKMVNIGFSSSSSEAAHSGTEATLLRGTQGAEAAHSGTEAELLRGTKGIRRDDEAVADALAATALNDAEPHNFYAEATANMRSNTNSTSAVPGQICGTTTTALGGAGLAASAKLGQSLRFSLDPETGCLVALGRGVEKLRRPLFYQNSEDIRKMGQRYQETHAFEEVQVQEHILKREKNTETAASGSQLHMRTSPRRCNGSRTTDASGLGVHQRDTAIAEARGLVSPSSAAAADGAPARRSQMRSADPTGDLWDEVACDFLDGELKAKLATASKSSSTTSECAVQTMPSSTAGVQTSPLRRTSDARGGSFYEGADSLDKVGTSTTAGVRFASSVAAPSTFEDDPAERRHPVPSLARLLAVDDDDSSTTSLLISSADAGHSSPDDLGRKAARAHRRKMKRAAGGTGGKKATTGKTSTSLSRRNSIESRTRLAGSSASSYTRSRSASQNRNAAIGSSASRSANTYKGGASTSLRSSLASRPGSAATGSNSVSSWRATQSLDIDRLRKNKSTSLDRRGGTPGSATRTRGGKSSGEASSSSPTVVSGLNKIQNRSSAARASAASSGRGAKSGASPLLSQQDSTYFLRKFNLNEHEDDDSGSPLFAASTLGRRAGGFGASASRTSKSLGDNSLSRDKKMNPFGSSSVDRDKTNNRNSGGATAFTSQTRAGANLPPNSNSFTTRGMSASPKSPLRVRHDKSLFSGAKDSGDKLSSSQKDLYEALFESRRSMNSRNKQDNLQNNSGAKGGATSSASSSLYTSGGPRPASSSSRKSYDKEKDLHKALNVPGRSSTAEVEEVVTKLSLNQKRINQLKEELKKDIEDAEQRFSSQNHVLSGGVGRGKDSTSTTGDSGSTTNKATTTTGGSGSTANKVLDDKKVDDKTSADAEAASPEKISSLMREIDEELAQLRGTTRRSPNADKNATASSSTSADHFTSAQAHGGSRGGDKNLSTANRRSTETVRNSYSSGAGSDDNMDWNINLDDVGLGVSAAAVDLEALRFKVKAEQQRMNEEHQQESSATSWDVFPPPTTAAAGLSFADRNCNSPSFTVHSTSQGNNSAHLNVDTAVRKKLRDIQKQEKNARSTSGSSNSVAGQSKNKESTDEESFDFSTFMRGANSRDEQASGVADSAQRANKIAALEKELEDMFNK